MELSLESTSKPRGLYVQEPTTYRDHTLSLLSSLPLTFQSTIPLVSNMKDKSFPPELVSSYGPMIVACG